MTRARLSFRIFLAAFAFGLFAVSVWTKLSRDSGEIPVDLPQIESESPLIVEPFACSETVSIDYQKKWGCYGGGGG